MRYNKANKVVVRTKEKNQREEEILTTLIRKVVVLV